jgi:hypothetical protein
MAKLLKHIIFDDIDRNRIDKIKIAYGLHKDSEAVRLAVKEKAEAIQNG